MMKRELGGASRSLPRGLAALCAGAAILLFAHSPAFGEDKASKGTKAKTESVLELATSMAFSTAVAGAATADWIAASGGPGLSLEARSGTLFGAWGLAWLSTGPLAEATAAISADSLSSGSDDPYIVVESAKLGGLLGWKLRVDSGAGALRFRGEGAAIGGLAILDFSESDQDYLESGADPEAFWFRCSPRLGFDLGGGLDAGRASLRLDNRFLYTWYDSGSAASTAAYRGFDESLDARLGYLLAECGNFGLRLKALAKFSLASRVTVPLLKASAAVRADLDWKRVGKLRFSPLAFSCRAKLPSLDLTQAEEVKRQLSGKIEWEPAMDGGAWSLALTFPWWADEDGLTSPGEWEFAFVARLGE